MLVNVSGITKENGASLDFQTELKLDEIEFQGELIKFPLPVKLKGKISNTTQILLTQVSTEGLVELQCGACTELYGHKFNFSYEAVYKRFVDQNDPDAFLYQNDRVDFKNSVLEHVILNLPTLRRCTEACKGICPACGVNMNLEQCKCSTANSENEVHS